ncbi:NAD(P)/FAD-dependent oxidoreductase [Streptomyces sp. URMC 123]|uniref:NAD(P)/FAD-dependent oxidoreductase n=1 Tax=Streptomyces sp. URMC 123 TaxID=3423403 RepID=UPI003F19E231
MTRRIAVVGAGMAAARFAHTFHALGGDADITLYGAEPRAPYNRVLLAEVLTGRYDAAAIALPHGAATVRTGAEVTAVDPAGRTLRLADGGGARYDTLVLATGAEPVEPEVRGLRGPDGARPAGVHTLRTVADCRRLAEDAVRARRAVVVGGGVLGVSTARALAALGLPVEIAHRAPHLVERHLDGQAAAVLGRGLAGLGVGVRLGAEAVALRVAGPGTVPEAGTGAEDGTAPGAESGRATARVTGVELADGRALDADLVVLACGVRPRTALARAAGLPVATGVVVDDTLSCAPGVHALGDCAEHRGTVPGLAAPAWEQADVLAARLSGADPGARYAGWHPFSRLTAGPLEYAAFGDPGEDGPGLDVLRLADATRGSYKKLVLRGDRLVGGILLGDLATVGALTRAYERGDPLPEGPLHLLTAQGATR